MNLRVLAVCSAALFGDLFLLPASAENPAGGGSTEATLRQAARARKLLVGAAVFPDGLKDEAYAGVLAREFNVLTPENALKWESVHPRPNKWTFDAADRLVEFAGKNQMKVTGHVLVWHQQLPEYVKGLPAKDLRQAVRSHIRGLVRRYSAAEMEIPTTATGSMNAPTRYEA